LIEQKLDRLDKAFLCFESIDFTSYSRQRDNRREELTLAKIETTPRRSTNSVYRAFSRSQNASCRTHQTCGFRRRSTTSTLQQLFFPEGVAFDGNRFNRTCDGTTLQLFAAVREW
jgi:hypothetical protein